MVETVCVGRRDVILKLDSMKIYMRDKIGR